MKKTFLFLLPLAAILASCGGDDGNKTVTPPIEAGKGGNAELRITPKHHQRTIDTCMVYIKYNTSEAPTSYDDSVQCTMHSGDTVAVFSGLKTGKYYLYGRGYDKGIFQTVVGGAPYTISSETVQNLNLYITEDHSQ